MEWDGDRLRQARGDMSRADAARELGVSPSSVQKWEAGAAPKPSQISRLNTWIAGRESPGIGSQRLSDARRLEEIHLEIQRLSAEAQFIVLRMVQAETHRLSESE